jgi:hypothetical protein
MGRGSGIPSDRATGLAAAAGKPLSGIADIIIIGRIPVRSSAALILHTEFSFALNCILIEPPRLIAKNRSNGPASEAFGCLRYARTSTDGLCQATTDAISIPKARALNPN